VFTDAKEAMKMTDRLTPAALALIEEPVLGNFATVDTRGHPQVTPVWIDHDGEDVIVNTAEGRAKTRNIARNPSVGMSIVDPGDPYHVVVFRGTVTDVTTEGADEHIDFLAKKYLGTDSYPYRRPGEVRVKVRIHPDRILAQPEKAAA
jgi:PPOX class probable F420-dependent enzyme